MKIFTANEFEEAIEGFDEKDFSPKINKIRKENKEKSDLLIDWKEGANNFNYLDDSVKKLILQTKNPKKIINHLNSTEDAFFANMLKTTGICPNGAGYDREDIFSASLIKEQWEQILNVLFNSDREMKKIESLIYAIINSINKKTHSFRDNKIVFNQKERKENMEFILKNLKAANLRNILSTKIMKRYRNKSYKNNDSYIGMPVGEAMAKFMMS